MDPVQVFFSIVLLAFLVINIRRFFLRRSVEQVHPGAIPPGAILLDVRTAAERSRDAIPGSIHIPIQELSSRSGELAGYQHSMIVCYCASGSRSLNAAVMLKKLGYSAANLAGGISGWKLAAGRR